MSDTKENMEKRVVSLASSGVIGYYIFSKLNAAQDTVEMPDDGLDLPPALKEATFYEGGLVSVESVKRMSEIIAEQARVYAATIRNGIRTPIVVEDEQPAEENIVNDELFEGNEEELVADENDTETIFGEEEDTTLPTLEFDDDADNEGFEEAPVNEFAEDEIAANDDENAFADPVMFGDAPADVDDNANVVIQEVYVPVGVRPAEDGEAAANAVPVTFEEMGGFEGNAFPVAAVPAEGADAMFANPMMPTMPSMEDVQFEPPTLVEEPTLMEVAEPLHKVEEEEEDPRNKEQFKSIADFLNTL